MKEFILVYVLCASIISVRGDRRDILISESKSWIPDENFTQIINVSFRSSKCCNVFLSDSMQESEALFDQFRKIYSYEYLLRDAKECHGHFLLGTTDYEIMMILKKISLLWKTEILIIMNKSVSSDSAILNNTIYGISNVNIVSRSEIWKLSENYLKPRMFIKVDRYEQMQQNNINFRGKELQACSLYQPPMTFLNRTIKKTIDSVQEEVYAMDSDSDWDGIEMHLFLLIAKKLNFTWTIRKPKGNYTYGRRFNETVWEGGIIQLLIERKVDIAFANIFVTMNQNLFVDLSPWYEVYMHFLVPRPRRTTSFWALARPFTTQVWYLLLSMLLLHTLYTYIRAKIDPHYPKQFQSFLVSLIDLIGYLLSSSVPKVITTNKLQILLWRIAGWLIITAYSSSLAARLSSWDFEARIDTIEQLIEANLSWGRTGQKPPFADFFDLKDSYASQLPNKYQHIDNYTQLQTLIAQGNYAILGNIIDTCFFPTDYVPNNELKNYRLMRQSLGHYQSAFAVQPWLLKSINMILLSLRETGITNWHLRDIIRRRNSYNLRDVLLEHDKYDGTVQVLGLMPLAAGFSLLLIGLSIATFVFYLEVKRIVDSISARLR